MPNKHVFVGYPIFFHRLCHTYLVGCLSRCLQCCWYTFFFFLTLYFPASGQAVVTGVVPSPPRFLPSIFIPHRVQQSHCSLLVDFLSSVANSRSRAFRKSICAQEKVPTNLYEYALGGARTHETDRIRTAQSLPHCCCIPGIILKNKK